MSKTYKIKNLKVTDTPLRDGEALDSMYVCNTTDVEQTFSLMVDDTHVYKDVQVPAYVTLILEEDIYYNTNLISISAGNADSIDVIYTIK